MTRKGMSYEHFNRLLLNVRHIRCMAEAVKEGEWRYF